MRERNKEMDRERVCVVIRKIYKDREREVRRRGKKKIEGLREKQKEIEK